MSQSKNNGNDGRTHGVSLEGARLQSVNHLVQQFNSKNIKHQSVSIRIIDDAANDQDFLKSSFNLRDRNASVNQYRHRSKWRCITSECQLYANSDKSFHDKPIPVTITTGCAPNLALRRSNNGNETPVSRGDRERYVTQGAFKSEEYLKDLKKLVTAWLEEQEYQEVNRVVMPMIGSGVYLSHDVKREALPLIQRAIAEAVGEFLPKARFINTVYLATYDNTGVRGRFQTWVKPGGAEEESVTCTISYNGNNISLLENNKNADIFKLIPELHAENPTAKIGLINAGADNNIGGACAIELVREEVRSTDQANTPFEEQLADYSDLVFQQSRQLNQENVDEAIDAALASYSKQSVNTHYMILGASQKEDSCMLNAPAVGAYLAHHYKSSETNLHELPTPIQGIIEACDKKNKALIKTDKKIEIFNERVSKDWLEGTAASGFDFEFEPSGSANIQGLDARLGAISGTSLLQLTTPGRVREGSPVIGSHSIIIGQDGAGYWIFDAKKKMGENEFKSVLYFVNGLKELKDFVHAMSDNLELNTVIVSDNAKPVHKPVAKASNRELHNEIDEQLEHYLTNPDESLKNKIINKINQYKTSKGEPSDKVKAYDQIVEQMNAGGFNHKSPSYTWMHSIAQAKKPWVQAAMELKTNPQAGSQQPTVSMHLITDYQDKSDGHTMELVKVEQNQTIFKNNDELASQLNAAEIKLTLGCLEYKITGRHENGRVAFYKTAGEKTEIITQKDVEDYKKNGGKYLSQEVMEQLANKLKNDTKITVCTSVREPKPKFRP